jgi:hypothetical protein
MKEQQNIKGVFRLRAFDKSGECVLNYEDKNLVVNAGRTSMTRLLAQAAVSADKRITKIAFGTSGTTPAVGDTSITSPTVLPLDSFSYPDALSVSFAWSLGFNDAVGVTIREFGLLSEDDTLFARKTREGIAKTSDIRLEGTWTITF